MTLSTTASTLDTIAHNPDARILNSTELPVAIIEECKKAAKRSGRKYGARKMDDLEGYLITEIWNRLQKKESSFHNLMFIRRLIRLMTINYIERELMPHNFQYTFSVLDAMPVQNVSTLGEDKDSFEHTIEDPSDMELSNALKDFLGSLSAKQRQIFDLHSKGYGNNEICEIVGCSINTPKNTMNKIKELAIEFGL